MPFMSLLLFLLPFLPHLPHRQQDFLHLVAPVLRLSVVLPLLRALFLHQVRLLDVEAVPAEPMFQILARLLQMYLVSFLVQLQLVPPPRSFREINFHFQLCLLQVLQALQVHRLHSEAYISLAFRDKRLLHSLHFRQLLLHQLARLHPICLQAV